MTSIEETIAKLGSKTKARLRNASEATVERMPLASLGLNLALNGGIGYGRQTLVWGNKSAGKTSSLLAAIGREQKRGKVAALIDVEGTFDAEWAKKLGVDTDALLLFTSKTTNAVTEDIIELEKAGVDIILVDSITALLPIAFLEDGQELKALEDSQKIASLSSDLSKACPMWNYANEKTALILISQQNNKFGSMHAEVIPSGGERVKFMSTTIIKLFSTTAKAHQINGIVHNGNVAFNHDIGRPVNWLVQNNKLGPQNRDGQYDFYYAGDHIGIDTVAETLDYGEKYGVVEKGGAWYTVYGERFQGRNKAIDYLRSNDDIYQKLNGELLDRVS